MADNYHLENIYQGGYSTLDPESGFSTKYRMTSSQIGLATDPRTANILQEVSTKLQTGAKEIEVSTIQPNTFEAIPKEMFTEINRLSKLTGIDISVHAPLVEPSGITEQGAYNDVARREAERQMLSAVEKSHIMSPEGNVPVTFHSSVRVPGAEYEKTKDGARAVRIPIINQDTGQANTLVQEMKRLEPGMTKERLEEGGRLYSAEDRLKSMNATQWADELTQLVAVKDRTDHMLHDTAPIVYPLLKKSEAGEIDLKYLKPDQQEVFSRYQNAGLEVEDIERHLSNMFERAYKYGTPEEKERLTEISKRYRETIMDSEKRPRIDPDDLMTKSRLMQDLMNQLRPFQPEVFKSVEKFAADKTAETFGNVAFNSYKQFKDKAPIISIENPPVGLGLARADELKDVVEKARAKFIENATAPSEKGGLGMSEKEAGRQAEKLIGVTWDVGHINMIRKYGYSEEDVIKEAEKVAPLVKHVHLSDNFGFEHTELPMGMGNVPIKQIMEKLGEKGFEARKVIEAGDWWQHFKTSPFQQTLEAFGSPIYGIKMQPYWTQAPGVVGYFGGYGNMLPQINYETFGAGFSGLPAELGGQRQASGRSRFGGQSLE